MDSKKAFARASKVLEIAARMAKKIDKELGTWEVSNRIDEIQLHSEYAEPGYDGDRIAIGNWNSIDKYDRAKGERVELSNLPERVCKILEKLGFECEWSDEWMSCHDCGKLVRNSPDSYSWTPSYAIVNECELLCHECIESDPSDYLEGLEGNSSSAMTLDIDLEDHGYTKVNEEPYESGFHEGQNDNPKTIMRDLESEGYDGLIFVLVENSQFYSKFDVYARVCPGDADLVEECEEMGELA